MLTMSTKFFQSWLSIERATHASHTNRVSALSVWAHFQFIYNKNKRGAIYKRTLHIHIHIYRYIHHIRAHTLDVSHKITWPQRVAIAGQGQGKRNANDFCFCDAVRVRFSSLVFFLFFKGVERFIYAFYTQQ